MSENQKNPNIPGWCITQSEFSDIQPEPTTVIFSQNQKKMQHTHNHPECLLPEEPVDKYWHVCLWLIRFYGLYLCSINLINCVNKKKIMELIEENVTYKAGSGWEAIVVVNCQSSTTVSLD